MKKSLLTAISAAIITALGITFVTLMKGENFSLFKSGLYAAVAFLVYYIFSFFDKKNI